MGRGVRRQHRSVRRIGFWAGLATTALAAAGCGDDVAPRAPHHKVGGAPVQPAPTVTGPLPDVSIEHSPLTLALSVPPGYLIDARLLVISADGSSTDSELAAIRQTLDYL